MPQLRTREERLSLGRRVASVLEDSFSVVLVLFGIVTLIFLFFVGIHSLEVHSTASGTKAHVTEILEQAGTPEQRQQVAESILTLDDAGMHTSIDTVNTGSISSNLREELQKVRETGNMPDITYEVKGFFYWLKQLGPTLLSTFAGAVLFVTFFGLVQVARPSYSFRRHYLMDLPWNKFWPYLLVAVTLPVGFVFYVVSAVRLLAAKHRQAVEEARRNAEAEEADDEEIEEPTPQQAHWNPAYDPTDELEGLLGRARQLFDEEDYFNPYHQMHARLANQRANESYRPVSSSSIGAIKKLNAPQAARRQYVELRTKKHADRLSTRKQEMDTRVASTEQELRATGQAVQALQRRLATEKSEARQIAQAIEEREKGGVSISEAEVEQEFEKILALPGVTSVGLVNDSIVIEIDAVIEHERKQYDGGTWRIWFGAGDRHLESKEIRSGVKESWLIRHHGQRGYYPDYRYSPSEDRFCFGGRFDEINSYIRKGQYYEAVQLAAHCMQSVNDADRSNIPNALKRLKTANIPNSLDHLKTLAKKEG